MTENNARAPNRSAYLIIAIFVALVAFNVISAQALPDSSPDSVFWTTVVGAWVIQPILFGVCTALPAGSVFLRLPLVMPCLVALIVAPELDHAVSGKTERIEFLMYAVGGLFMFALTTIIFLAFRKFARLRIVCVEESRSLIATRIRFNLKYLLAITTTYALLLAMISLLRFREPTSTWPSFAPDLYWEVFGYATAICYVVSLPILSVPLLLMSDKISGRAIAAAVAFWVVATTGALGFLLFGSGERANPELFEGVALMQVGSAVLSSIVAISLRMSGFRLARLST